MVTCRSRRWLAPSPDMSGFSVSLKLTLMAALTAAPGCFLEYDGHLAFGEDDTTGGMEAATDQDPCDLAFEACLDTAIDVDECIADREVCREEPAAPNTSTSGQPSDTTTGGTSDTTDAPETGEGTSGGTTEGSDAWDGSTGLTGGETTGEPEEPNAVHGDQCHPIDAPCDTEGLLCVYITDPDEPADPDTYGWYCIYDDIPGINGDEGDECLNWYTCKEGLMCAAYEQDPQSKCRRMCMLDSQCYEGETCNLVGDNAVMGYCIPDPDTP